MLGAFGAGFLAGFVAFIVVFTAPEWRHV